MSQITRGKFLVPKPKERLPLLKGTNLDEVRKRILGFREIPVTGHPSKVIEIKVRKQVKSKTLDN